MKESTSILESLGYKFDRKEGVLERVEKDIKLELPEKIDGQYIRRLGDSLFCEMDFEEVILPSTINEIGSKTFAYNQITSVELPISLKVIHREAFRWNELEEIRIPYGVLYIGANAFSNNKSLIRVSIPDTVLEIGSDVFDDTGVDLVIVCPKGSKAEEYALANGHTIEYSASMPELRSSNIFGKKE
ncbi:leucine-rich repeat domain-containing protein [Lysinibacillus xylanilyticus]|uniref:leucine-rich repeat domain-containing protein n=1 Tax=Lysinibacillus xylanilyticus TaxID=582475 RepID=UPI0036D9C17D